MVETGAGCITRKAFRSWTWMALCILIVQHGLRAADDDPLPPLPADPNQVPPTDWSAWQSVSRLQGVSQADIRTSYSFHSETLMDRSTGQESTTVFMELSLRETLPGARMLSWEVSAATAQAAKFSTYSKFWLGGGLWLGGEGVTKGSYTGPLSLRVNPALMLDSGSGVGTFMTLHETAQPISFQLTGTVHENAFPGVRIRPYDELQVYPPEGYSLEHSYVESVPSG